MWRKYRLLERGVPCPRALLPFMAEIHRPPTIPNARRPSSQIWRIKVGTIIAETAYIDRVSGVRGRADPENRPAERIKNLKTARFAKMCS